MSSDVDELPAETETTAFWRSPLGMAFLGLAFFMALTSGWVGAAHFQISEGSAEKRAQFSGGGALPLLHAAFESAMQTSRDSELLEKERQRVVESLNELQRSLNEESQKVVSLKKQMGDLAGASVETTADPAQRKRLAEAKLAILEKLAAAADALVAARSSLSEMDGRGSGNPFPFNEQSLATWKKEWQQLTEATASQIQTAQKVLIALKEIQVEWNAWNQQAGHDGMAFPRLEEAKSHIVELDAALAQVRKNQPDTVHRLESRLHEMESRLDTALATLEKDAAP